MIRARIFTTSETLNIHNINIMHNQYQNLCAFLVRIKGDLKLK